MSESLKPSYPETHEYKPDFEKNMDAIEHLLGEETLESYGEGDIVPEAYLEALENVSIESVFASVRSEKDRSKKSIDDVAAELFGATGENYSQEELRELNDIIDHYKIRIDGLETRFNTEAEQILSGNESLSTQELDEAIIRTLENRKKSVEGFVAKMGDSDEDAFRELTGLTPEEEVEFSHTPYTVELYVSDKDYKEVRGTLIKDYDPEKDTSAGFYIDHTSKHGNLGLIVARKEQSELDRVLVHERQHALRNLIERDWKRRVHVFLHHFEIEKKDPFEILEKLDGDYKVFVATDILHTIKFAKVERTVKDEALAYFRMGAPASVIEEQLVENPTYNKFPEMREALVGHMVRHGLSKDKAESIFNSELEEGYESEIKQATSLMDDLLVRGLSREEIVNLLTDKRFEDWPRVVQEL